jgi:hypothetical protein
MSIRLATAVTAGAFAISGTVSADEPRHVDTRAQVPLSEARSECLATFIKPRQSCAVGDFGRIGTVAERDLFFARYDVMPPKGDPDDALPYRRLVIFERTASNMVRPILVSGDDPAYYYDTPRIVRSDGRILLHVPASESGTGNFNQELLYVWANDAWRDVDTTPWLKELPPRLPKGLDARKGIYPNYVTLKATTPLWRKGDAGACPTGGIAEIALQWRGDQIALRDVRVIKGGECSEPLRR